MKLSCVIPTMLLAATTSIVSADFPATVLPVENTWLNGRPMLVPEVQQIKQTGGRFKIPESVTLAVPDSEMIIAEQLANALKRFDITVAVGDDDTTCRFALTIDGTPTHWQGYRLVIDESKIYVTARTTDGLFYGAQTLLNLIRNSSKPELDCLEINDWPDFNRRGYFMTIRNMKSDMLPVFKKSLDAMASLKLNWLLLSIEEAFPYEPNPLVNRPNAFTREEMQDLADFCRARHIEITPSMQLWSHARWMTYHPDWESKMTEGGPSSSWSCQLCPHSQEANDLTEEAVKQQIEFFRPKVFFLMMDEIFLGPYAQCPRCKADPDLTATYVKELKFLENTVKKHGVRPMVCQDSFENTHWKYGEAMRKALDPNEMILWWSYRDRLPEHTMAAFRDFQLVGHSLMGKPFNTQNMLRAIRANGGYDSTIVYWYYSANGQFTNLKTECPDSLGGFVNGLDFMWKYRETPYWQLQYDGTFEMIRRLQVAKSVVPECRDVTPIPL
ncbi:MAG: beta-N-acetylhexosaminidase, partial [Victivallales bacterium]|nr:beta-N-acetylhexosaminidase [Victivallales bacterium]